MTNPDKAARSVSPQAKADDAKADARATTIIFFIEIVTQRCSKRVDQKP
jgi:hypothetical protein